MRRTQSGAPCGHGGRHTKVDAPCSFRAARSASAANLTHRLPLRNPNRAPLFDDAGEPAVNSTAAWQSQIGVHAAEVILQTQDHCRILSRVAKRQKVRTGKALRSKLMFASIGSATHQTDLRRMSAPAFSN
jgi:hypothetical protein